MIRPATTHSFIYGFWGLNSCPCAYMTSTLFTLLIHFQGCGKSPSSESHNSINVTFRSQTLLSVVIMMRVDCAVEAPTATEATGWKTGNAVGKEAMVYRKQRESLMTCAKPNVIKISWVPRSMRGWGSYYCSLLEADFTVCCKSEGKNS